MTQRNNELVSELLTHMDLRLQDYVLDMLRHLKSAQNILLEEDTSYKSPIQ